MKRYVSGQAAEQGNWNLRIALSELVRAISDVNAVTDC